jgi:hypothetical protein
MLNGMISSFLIPACADKNEGEAKRLALYETYYKWLKNLLIQVLIADDMMNKGWLATNTNEEIFNKAVEGINAIEQYRKTYENVIRKDKSGWLLKGQKRIQDNLNNGIVKDYLLAGPLKGEAAAYLGEGIGNAFSFASSRMDKKSAIAMWNEKIAKNKDLKSYIKAEINNLKGIKRVNLVNNGNFEKGTAGDYTPGNPPKLPGWWFYDRVGQVRNSKCVYEWKDNSYNNTKAIGMGPGKYSGMRGFVDLKAGRYKMTFQYKSKGRKQYNLTMGILGIKKVTLPELNTPEAVRGIENHQYQKFLSIPHKVSEEKWQKITKEFTVERDGLFCILVEPFWGEPDSWVWYDDISIVKLD